MRRLVVTYDVAVALGVTASHQLEELHKGLAPRFLSEEPERPAGACVECTHEREGAVTNVLELPFDRSTGHHGHVFVATFERLHARLLVAQMMCSSAGAS